VKINKKDLIDALKSVKPGVSSKEIIEHSNHFVFTGDAIRSYNDQISIYKPMKTEINGAVKANEFYELISKLNAKEIDIDVDMGQIHIKAGKTKAKISIEEEYSTPIIDIDKIDKWIKLPEGFLDAISFCLFSAGSDMTIPALTNINIKQDRVISSDRFRITRYVMDKKIKKAMLLPALAASSLIPYKPTSYSVEPGWLHFTNEDDVCFSCRTTDADYPAVDNFFDIDGEEVTLPGTLKDTIDRVKILAKTDFDQDLKIKISLTKGTLTCKGEGKLGSVEESVRVKYKGNPIEVFIHPGFLQDILSKLKTVTIGEKSFLFKGDNFEHVISLVAG